MAKDKYWDGTKWVQVAPSMKEFTTHLADNAAHGIGDKATLQTTHKTTLVGAINEAFTSASNGKSAVSAAITGIDPEVVIPTDPTFPDLVTAIGQISTGKKWASGTIVDVNRGNVKNLEFNPDIVVIYQNRLHQFAKYNVLIAKLKGGLPIFSPNESHTTIQAYNDGTAKSVTGNYIQALDGGFSYVNLAVGGIQDFTWFAFE